MTPPTPNINKLRRSKALAPIGLYFTPRNANGMSNGMMMALKMTADRMALSGE